MNGDGSKIISRLFPLPVIFLCAFVLYVLITGFLADDFIENFMFNIQMRSSAEENQIEILKKGLKKNLSARSESNLDLVRNFIDNKCYKSDIVERFEKNISSSFFDHGCSNPIKNR